MNRPSSLSDDELVRACAASNDSAVWNEFVSRFHRPIAVSIFRVAYQWGAATEQVDDLVQETYLKLCANQLGLLRDFATQHPQAVMPYIRTIAANLAHDHFKALHSKKRGAGQVESIENFEPWAGSASPGGHESVEREVLLGEIEEALVACTTGPESARDRLIFRLYYRQGMSAKAIASLPGLDLNAKGVESVIHRVTRSLRDRLASVRSRAAPAAGPSEKGIRPAESY